MVNKGAKAIPVAPAIDFDQYGLFPGAVYGQYCKCEVGDIVYEVNEMGR